MRTLLKVAGGVIIVVVSFLVTNYILESRNTPASRDAQRIADIKKIREAVRSYHRAKSSVFPKDLKLLVDARYLDAVPVDPLWSGTKKGYQYYTDGSIVFGLLVSLEERHGDVPAGASCRTGVGAKETMMWGADVAECPF